MKKLFAFAIILGAMMVAISVNCEGCSQTGKIVIGK